MRVLYTKINHQRLPEFQTATSVVDADGKKLVRKQAVGNKAVHHMKKMLHACDRLTSQLGYRCLPLREAENGVEYDFINGVTLAQKLIDAAANNDKDLYDSLIGRYVDIVRGNTDSHHPFRITDEFKNIFGSHEYLDDDIALPVADIDVNPENIFCVDGEYVIVDYEWFFDFPVPVNYILYRNLREFYIKHKSILKKQKTLDAVFIEYKIEKNRLVYEEMDRNFIKMVHGDFDDSIWTRYRQKDYTANLETNELIVGFAVKEIERLNDEIVEIAEQRKTIDNERRHYYEHFLYYKNLADALLASRSYRFSKKLAEKFIPAGSKRRGIAKKVFRMLKPIPDTNVPAYVIPKRSKYDVISIPEFDSITVSVIIPVYNQFSYTYNCIDSIVKNTSGVSYEIILADDMSGDSTKYADRFFKNAKIVRNSKNLGFLLNCKNAAVHAAGEYILFLNNDTQVLDGWLTPLVDIMEKRSDVGLTGSMLIGADGRLQEAGGIIWRDATGWNYGLGDDPCMPEYNYVKESDYISGACMMIRKTLWNDIGGFDERFVPAYFEDTDIAFEVRRHGYKVVYQPLSRVVHFEGVSNGTSEETGIKSYQKVNREKFKLKWQNELDNNHFENAENIFAARDRSRDKKAVLVVDHYVPTFDKDAGSRAVFNYLCLLVDMGYNVKFIGDNFNNEEPYTTALEQMGIEVLYGQRYSGAGWQPWLLKNKEYFSAAILNRPHITVRYIDFIKNNARIKTLYYGHDLNFLRVMREYDETQDPVYLEEANKWKVRERRLMKKADCTIMLSEEEKRIIKKEFDVDTVTVPIFCYRSFDESIIDFDKKKDILFVGGFSHRPNENGLKWFVDNVWPVVKAAIPDIRLHVVGSHPTETVKSMASDSIFVHGFVSDEELEGFYRNCRVCIIPLRYGAGIKGKTIEAMYNRISLVSTFVGVEGLPGIENIIRAEDTAGGFAEQVIKKYNDTEILKRDSEAYVSFLKQNFSYDKLRCIFKNLIEER